MTPTDDVDRAIIGQLQINGRASWTEIADHVQRSIPSTARRGQNLITTGAVRVGVMPTYHGQSAGQLKDIRIVCSPGTQLQVAATLVDLPDLRFLALTTGRFDLIGELAYPADIGEQVHIIQKIQQIPGVQRCITNPHIHTYKSSQRWLRQTLGHHIPDEPPEPPTCDTSHVDNTDRKIADAMRSDARLSIRALAEQLGMNESTVGRRFEAMLEHGCLQIITLVSATAVGYEAEVLLDVAVKPPQIAEVAEQLAQHDGVRYIAASLSSPTLFCEIILPSADMVHTFLSEYLASMPGVRTWEAASELLTFKRGFIETPWWRKTLTPQGTEKAAATDQPSATPQGSEPLEHRVDSLGE